MIVAHKIRMYPTKAQEILLKKSCGCARFTYNWALNKWNEEYKAGNKPSYLSLKKQFNAIKKEHYPFVTEVTKCASETAFVNLGRAFNNFFHHLSKYPQFKKKGQNDSFGLNNDQFHFIDDKHIKLPKIGSVKIAESLRFTGKIMSATVSYQGNKWFISIAVDCDFKYYQKTNKHIGIDLGVKDLIITSDGYKFDNLQHLKKSEKKLKRLQRKVSKAKKGSNRRQKAKLKLSNQHLKVSNQRKDYIHKITSYLVKQYDVICMEDLNAKGMLKNHKLAKAISNVAFGEIKRQLQYKCDLTGKTLLCVDRFFPSSKTCCSCGCIQEKMPLNIREWTCPDCGEHHDRDFNAATNIIRQALSNFKHGEKLPLPKEPMLVSNVSSVRQVDSLNREVNCILTRL